MGFHWSIHQLTEYFAAVSVSADEDAAVAVAVERAVEALDAEVGGAVLSDRPELVGLVGLATPLPVSQIGPVLHGSTSVELPDLGLASAWYAGLGTGVDGGLFVARLDEELSAEERQMLQGMAQVLGLALRNLGALALERSARADRERLAAHRLELLETVRARQALLETLLAIQRGISKREPLHSVLDAITQGASNLLGEAGIALVLTDPAEPANLIMAANHRWPAAATAGALAAAAAAMKADEMVECWPSLRAGQDEPDCELQAAPVHVSGAIGGSLVAVQHPDTHDASLLAAFAQQISMALTDAHTVEAMREAYRDPLTGLPNRALFLERLERALNDRHGGPVVVLFIDLDRFKAVNDSLGHRAGDELLTEVAARMRETLRSSDLAARLGGDEFAVLLEGGSADDACRIAERIAARVAEPFQIANRTAYIGASVGVALCEANGADAAELLSNADVAMYRAKKTGQGSVVVFEPTMHTEVLTQLDLEVDLKNALTADQLRVHYQPIVDLATGALYSAEALLRWQHPTRGQVRPDAFIPMAEKTGMITEIGWWVLHEAVAELAALRRTLPDLRVSVNFSPRTVTDRAFVREVTEALAAAGLPGSALTVELTETALMSEPGLVLRHLRAVKDHGVRIALDDFGTGYSSLAHLRQFPVDQLKIDRTFVASLCSSSEDRAVVRAIVDLAVALRLQVVAEGVEDAGQQADLVDMGCPLGQGYHLYRPMPAADLRHLVHGQRPRHRVSDDSALGTIMDRAVT